jgi:hypothetical protein
VSIFVSLFSFRTLTSPETDVMAGGVRRSGERCNDGYVKEEPSTTDSKRQIRAVRATFIVGIRGVRDLLVGELVAQVVPDGAAGGLGSAWTKSVPVEVLPLNYVPVTRKLQALGASSVALRMSGSSKAGPPPDLSRASHSLRLGLSVASATPLASALASSSMHTFSTRRHH